MGIGAATGVVNRGGCGCRLRCDSGRPLVEAGFGQTEGPCEFRALKNLTHEAQDESTGHPVGQGSKTSTQSMRPR
jgi:hypothetical protein